MLADRKPSHGIPGRVGSSSQRLIPLFTDTPAQPVNIVNPVYSSTVASVVSVPGTLQSQQSVSTSPVQPQSGSSTVRHIRGLDGIRGLAALAVVIAHLEAYKRHFGIDSFYGPASSALAANAVSCFFTLSGFLITYLLIREHVAFQTISIPRFYARRILRIWPLYFTVFLAGYYVAPQFASLPSMDSNRNPNDISQALLFVFFLPNIVNVFHGSITFLSPLWSVGIEEQFYAIWPWLVRIAKTRRLLVVLVSIAAGMAILRCSVTYLLPVDWRWKTLLRTLEFDSMAIGGIGAVLYHNGFGTSRRVNRHLRMTAAAGFAFVVIYTAAGNPHRALFVTALAVAFASCLLFIARNPESAPTRTLEASPLRMLGAASYGIYLLHSFVIIGLLNVAAIRDMLAYPYGQYLLLLLTLVFTIGVSLLSLWYLETPFLRLKRRFTRLRFSLS